MKKLKKTLYLSITLFTGVSFLVFYTIISLLPTKPGKAITFCIKKQSSFGSITDKLAQCNIIRNPKLFSIYIRYIKHTSTINAGNYILKPGTSMDEILNALKKPQEQFLRIPEGWWIKRVALLLEKKGVCKSSEYIQETNKPTKYQQYVSFKLPESGSLEGYLFPDTYDLPVNYSAKNVIIMQLKEFEKKVLPLLPQKKMRDTLILASILELEALGPQDARKMAGVIQNRLQKKMRLELCSTALYGLGEWRELKPGETALIHSPYNTYHHDGLPPGPLCSPSLPSIQAALEPEKTHFLYFVAHPDGKHLYAHTFLEHQRNINVRKRALKEKNKTF